MDSLSMTNIYSRNFASRRIFLARTSSDFWKELEPEEQSTRQVMHYGCSHAAVGHRMTRLSRLRNICCSFSASETIGNRPLAGHRASRAPARRVSWLCADLSHLERKGSESESMRGSNKCASGYLVQSPRIRRIGCSGCGHWNCLK